MKNKEAAIAAIRTCKDGETLNYMLNQFEVLRPEEIITFLNECMYNPQTFNSAEPDTIEDEAEFTKQIFLTGTWRLDEYYDLLEIKKAAVYA